MKTQNMKPQLQMCRAHGWLGYKASLNGTTGFGHTAMEALVALTIAVMFHMVSV